MAKRGNIIQMMYTQILNTMNLMENHILRLIDEQTSPLFRIMSIYNDDEISRKSFGNNISAFHIGKGYVLSVAHNLRNEAQVLKSISEGLFQSEIIAKCQGSEEHLFYQSYAFDPITNKRYLSLPNNNNVQHVINALQHIKFDTRWVSLYSKKICKPFMIVNFKKNQFYNDTELAQLFQPSHFFHEPKINAYTFLIELELVEEFYSSDIALYKIVNTNQNIIDKIPSIPISYDLSSMDSSLYCLQGSPSGTNLGRMINKSRIEGILDQHSVLNDRIGGPVFFEGIRYLLKGYFRFGSSGAPYLKWNSDNKSFSVNAIQSEASPIQLSINGNRNGNYQYINAIASPLFLIKDKLEERSFSMK
ncbi:MAG: hypothetical protein MK207_05800 [Saprospiraceae bacterium]|nr:hypothetical protein [Saprospiraceae bacterium]